MIRSMMTVLVNLRWRLLVVLLWRDIGNDKKHDDSVGQSVMKGIVGNE
ncbi:hypothetical protein Hdeb2414_s0001g00015091 [Helianthus debilis subsp. tardiflorus]